MADLATFVLLNELMDSKDENPAVEKQGIRFSCPVFSYAVSFYQGFVETNPHF